MQHLQLLVDTDDSDNKSYKGEGEGAPPLAARQGTGLRHSHQHHSLEHNIESQHLINLILHHIRTILLPLDPPGNGCRLLFPIPELQFQQRIKTFTNRWKRSAKTSQKHTHLRFYFPWRDDPIRAWTSTSVTVPCRARPGSSKCGTPGVPGRARLAGCDEPELRHKRTDVVNLYIRFNSDNFQKKFRVSLV